MNTYTKEEVIELVKQNRDNLVRALELIHGYGFSIAADETPIILDNEQVFYKMKESKYYKSLLDKERSNVKK